MRAKRFVLNTILLTLASLIIRGIGLFFQVFLSNKIGASGIGLFQLIMSVQILAVTFAVSGIRFAVCRLVSEEIGLNRPSGIRPAVRRCLVYALVFGLTACAIMFFGAYRIGAIWIGDNRTVLSIRILALCLPFIAVSSVMGGYFTAVQRIVKSSSAQIFEHIIRLAAVMFLVSLVPAENLKYACAAVSIGNVVGEFLSTALVYTLYLLDVRRYRKAGANSAGMTRRLLGIAVPVALSAYARTALGTLQHLLVPSGLRKSGFAQDAALASYGTISGMVLPVILFPIAAFTSVAEMVIPNLTDAQVRGDMVLARRIVNRILSLCLFFSIGICGVFFAFSKELGDALYHSAGAGYYIRVFAPLVIIMYMDTVTDGMLKGLGQHMYSMYVNIADAGLSVIMVFFLLPVYAVPAYAFTIWFTEVFNFALSIRRLSKVITVTLPFKNILQSVFCILGAVNLSILLLRTVGLPLAASLLSITLHMLLTLVFYYVFLRAFSCLTKTDVRSFATLFKS